MKLVTTLILNIIFTALAVLLARRFIPGIDLDSREAAFVISGILAVTSWIVNRILHRTTTPSTFLFGLISFIATAVFVFILSSRYPGFHMETFRTAFPFTALLTLVQILTGVKKG